MDAGTGLEQDRRIAVRDGAVAESAVTRSPVSGRIDFCWCGSGRLVHRSGLLVRNVSAENIAGVIASESGECCTIQLRKSQW